MNNRNLTRQDALDQLIICRLKLSEFLHLFRLWTEIADRKVSLELDPTETLDDYRETLRTAALSWLASLIDKSKDAINIFDVWKSCFPSEAAAIEKVWRDNERAFQLLRDFRNTTGFHGHKSVDEHLRVRHEIVAEGQALKRATDDFFALAIRMLKIESQTTDFSENVKQKLRSLGLEFQTFLRRFGYVSDPLSSGLRKST